MAMVAPRDGTVLSIVGQGLVADQALGLSKQLKADLREFNWIANITSSNQMLVVWQTAPTKTLEDAKHRETTIAASGAGEGSASVQYPAFYNHVLGTKFKVILGYSGGPQINLAMERGEAEGRGTNTYASYMASTPHYIQQKLIVPLIQIGLHKDPALPDVPLLLDQPVTTENRALVEFLSKASTVGRPLATTPGVPQDRVAALRKAFLETVKDPEFIEDARKLKAEIDPAPGEEVQKLISDLMNTPPDVRKRVAAALGSGPETAIAK
ncbi:MAG: tripartite tricarboxylate transporter family receptor [Hyphomicrobiales bacterium]|nr:tripartite tricarboxylate transporter family receptor [Hyphomicrobiales bacterium]